MQLSLSTDKVLELGSRANLAGSTLSRGSEWGNHAAMLGTENLFCFVLDVCKSGRELRLERWFGVTSDFECLREKLRLIFALSFHCDCS